MEAAIGVTCLQAKEHGGLPAATISWKGGTGQFFPESPEKFHPTEPLILDLGPSKLWENMFFLVLSHHIGGHLFQYP